MRRRRVPCSGPGLPASVRALAAVLALLVVGPVGAGPLEPIRASYDAVPGQALILAMRPVGRERPGARVTLRFPDGREVPGEVAAVRLTPPEGGRQSWLAPGARWEVLAPDEVRGEFERLAWFILADLPDGVIGQELWLDGRPIALRWLPRPTLLAARLGFDAKGGAGPMLDPWASPLPEDWRDRPDLNEMLAPAQGDPLRRWRARLAVRGLHPDPDRGVGAITPDQLRSGLVEASARVGPLGERLLEAVSNLAEARWRVGLARLWAGDPGLSLRVRHALAGAGVFEVDGGTGERVVAPVWAADARRADVLLEMLLDESVSAESRGRRVEEWFAALPDGAMWVIDDGGPGRGARVGAMILLAGDATAIELLGESIARPSLLRTRTMSILRTGTPGAERAGFRLGGKDRWLGLEGGAARGEPPGVAIGPAWGDASMERWLVAGESGVVGPADERLAGLVSARPGASGGLEWTVFIRLEGVEEASRERVRLWIGPYGQSRGVVTLDGDGGLDLHRFRAWGEGLGEARLVGAVREGAGVRIELVLPDGAIDPDGMLHLGLERVDGRGNRWAWPRAMLPWQIEPGRRVIDTTAWMGRLTP